MEILIVLVLVPVAIMIAVVALLIFLSASREPVAEGEEASQQPARISLDERPWWGNPLFWLAVSAVSIVLGLFVWPQLLGGVFLFLPFIWIGGRRSVSGPSRSRARASA
jgi:hypothetical protein